MKSLYLGALALLASGLVACSTGDDTVSSTPVTGDGSTGDDTSTTIDPDGGISFDATGEMGGCTPKTCTELGVNCGPVANGCGGLVECGTCTAPLSCGGGGKPNVCGTSCKGLTCADLKAECGKQGDGCGLIVDCGSCTAPATCGGGGPSKCGTLGGDAGPCTAPKKCSDYGANCGYVSDGCGAVVKCGDCTAPETCGGGGTPSVCGKPATTCVGLACKQVTCTAPATSSLSGKVYDPAGVNPLYNVFVYIPNAAVAAFTDGATCDKCADALSGYPLVQTVTNEKGEFKLNNVPVGTDIPVVIQTGKWRRQIKVTTASCVDTPLAASLTRLPRTKAEGDIPKIALATGGYDSIECLLRKVGIADSEFTGPTGTGRVHLYKGQPGTGPQQAASKYDAALGGANFPDATTLWANVASLKKYDNVVLGCEGDTYTATKTAANLKAMFDYVNQGGRVFASHYHHYWISGNTNGSGTARWSTLASWNYPSPGITTSTGSLTIPEKINTTFPKGLAMANWLLNVAGSTTLGTLNVLDAKQSAPSIDVSRVTEWIYAENARYSTTTYPRLTQYMSFNAPVEATAGSQCGRLVFSDIHVATGDRGTSFPSECKSTGMQPQEKALEFMLFDLSSRVCDETVPPPPPTCTKLTCAAAGVTCGLGGDGCGGILDCGPCPCTPQTCMGRCGPQGDGCGGVLACTPCDGGSGCTPRTCTEAGAECGIIGDGCGSTVDCGMCVAPKTCGGSGTPYKCGGVM